MAGLLAHLGKRDRGNRAAGGKGSPGAPGPRRRCSKALTHLLYPARHVSPGGELRAEGQVPEGSRHHPDTGFVCFHWCLLRVAQIVGNFSISFLCVCVGGYKMKSDKYIHGGHLRRVGDTRKAATAQGWGQCQVQGSARSWSSVLCVHHAHVGSSFLRNVS